MYAPRSSLVVTISHLFFILNLLVGGGGLRPTWVEVTTSYTHLAIAVDNIHPENTTFYVNGTKVELHKEIVSKIPEKVSNSALLGLCYTRKILSQMDVREKFGDVDLDELRLWAEWRTAEQIQETMTGIISVQDNSSTAAPPLTTCCIGGPWTMGRVPF